MLKSRGHLLSLPIGQLTVLRRTGFLLSRLLKHQFTFIFFATKSFVCSSQASFYHSSSHIASHIISYSSYLLLISSLCEYLFSSLHLPSSPPPPIPSSSNSSPLSHPSPISYHPTHLHLHFTPHLPSSQSLSHHLSSNILPLTSSFTLTVSTLSCILSSSPSYNLHS